jgi:hypothetical protein
LTMGSASDKMLEKAMGSAGLLGVAIVIDESGLFPGPPNTTPLCRILGEVMLVILGDRGIVGIEPCGWPCGIGDCGGRVDATGDVYDVPL